MVNGRRVRLCIGGRKGEGVYGDCRYAMFVGTRWSYLADMWKPQAQTRDKNLGVSGIEEVDKTMGGDKIAEEKRRGGKRSGGER